MARFRKEIPVHEGMSAAIEDAYMSAGFRAELRDCIVDIDGDKISINKRPGLKEILNLGTSSAINGLYWWIKQAKAVAIYNGNGYLINTVAGAKTDLTGTYFTAGNNVVMAEGPTNVYGSDEGVINVISTSTVSEMADADAPQTVSHLAFLDQYLLANQIGTNKCHFSDVGAPTSWSSNWFSAEAKEDYIKAIHVENLQAFLFGEKSLEVWYDTGASDPFARLDGGYIPSGTFAPHSIKYCGPPVNSFVWLDHERNLVVLNGRTPTVLSASLNKYLQQDGKYLFSAIGDYCVLMGHPIYILSLPDNNDTIAYDFKNGLWYNWSYWSGSAYQRWLCNNLIYAQPWGSYLVGSWVNGKVYVLGESTYKDGTYDIRTFVRSPFIDRGDNGAWKICNYVDITVKVTDSSSISTITLYIRYRNADSYAFIGEWTTAKTITIYPSTSEGIFTARVRRLGRYKSRQWEIYTTTASNLSIFPPVEDYEIVYS